MADDSRGNYNTNSKIKFETLMLSSIFFDYSDAYILVKATITVPDMTVTFVTPNNRNKKAIFKNCASFSDCKGEINNTEIDHAKDIDVAMPMYNLVEYSDNYSKKFGSLWKYYTDEPALNNNCVIIDFRDNTLLT